MTEQWFLQDFQKEMAVRNRVLVLDPQVEYGILLRLVQLLRLAQEMAISGAIVP